MAAKEKKKIMVTSPKKGISHQGKDQGDGQESTLIMRKKNFILLGIAFAVVVLGLLLMLGGSMPSPDVWDEGLIYSFRRITLAPIVILTGLGIGFYSIFK